MEDIIIDQKQCRAKKYKCNDSSSNAQKTNHPQILKEQTLPKVVSSSKDNRWEDDSEEELTLELQTCIKSLNLLWFLRIWQIPP